MKYGIQIKWVRTEQDERHAGALKQRNVAHAQRRLDVIKACTSEKFWWLLGFDQYLHYMTYILLIYIAA